MALVGRFRRQANLCATRRVQGRSHILLSFDVDSAVSQYGLSLFNPAGANKPAG